MIPCLQIALQKLTAGSLGQQIMPLHQYLHVARLAYRHMLHQGQGPDHSHVIGKLRSSPYAFSKHPLMLRCHVQDAHPLYILNIAKIFNDARGGPTGLHVWPSKHFCTTCLARSFASRSRGHLRLRLYAHANSTWTGFLYILLSKLRGMLLGSQEWLDDADRTREAFTAGWRLLPGLAVQPEDCL